MAPGGHKPGCYAGQVSPLTHSTTCRQDTGSSTCFPGSFSCLRPVRVLQTTPFSLHVTKTHPLTWVPATLERCHSFLFGPCLTMKVPCWKKSLCHVNFTSLLLLTQSQAKFRERWCLWSLWRWGCAAQGSQQMDRRFSGFSPVSLGAELPGER